jgi:putative Ca2+/H+ antiporter (TMEM165/GDT1 family)
MAYSASRLSRLGETFGMSASLQGWAGSIRPLVIAARPKVHTVDALFVSLLVVALGEIGDKTQLLSLLLAARFQRPVPIILGIVVATVLNHLLAGLVGVWVRSALTPEVLRVGLGVSFLALAAWTLVPDTLEERRAARGQSSVFLVTLLTFFLAEMGDKTQVATVMLAAKYQNLGAVVTGTTLGMLVADVPAVLVGQMAAPKLPLPLVRAVAAIVFAVLGIGVLLGFGNF